jgi:two-component system, chemotaxis family, protein-glutamate methylesterase/glutaminase
MFEAAVIGVSAGGMRALKTILPALPAAFPLPIAIVQHLDAQADAYLAGYLDRLSAITVKEGEDKETMLPGTAYLAPAGYHLLIEPDRSLSLSVDEKVNFSRPSIDLLFESAADALGEALIGIVLTGANGDGARGLKAIKDRGGFAIVQDPKTAEVPYMPRAALDATLVDHVAHLERIAPLLMQLCKGDDHGAGAEGRDLSGSAKDGGATC